MQLCDSGSQPDGLQSKSTERSDFVKVNVRPPLVSRGDETAMIYGMGIFHFSQYAQQPWE